MTAQNQVIQNNHGFVADYIKLTKPMISALLVFTSVSALVVASGGNFSAVVFLGTVLGGWLASAGASVMNQYLERDLDKNMMRTRTRPLPSGRIAPLNALIFGVALLIWSALILLLMVNALAMILALLGAAYYVLLYTVLLKRNTSLNVVIGGGAGAFPILVGWAAATGTLEAGALLLFAIVFFWTPPHSWAFALLVQGDYERGTVPMMPVLYGSFITHLHIIWYTAHLLILTLIVYGTGLLGEIYLVSAVVLGLGLLWQIFQLMRNNTKLRARYLYKYSSLYLLFLFLSMMLDRLIL